MTMSITPALVDLCQKINEWVLSTLESNGFDITEVVLESRVLSLEEVVYTLTDAQTRVPIDALRCRRVVELGDSEVPA